MHTMYEYKCSKCDITFESNIYVMCPECKSSEHCKRLYSIGGVILKGSGWASKEK